jgi:uncharacterized protein YjbJ (UPF0337 family)
MKDVIQGNWKQLKGSVKEQWNKLTDDELDEIEGSRQKLSGKIQEKYGKTKMEADKEIDKWNKKNAA